MHGVFCCPFLDTDTNTFNLRTGFLRYANEAVYPFYILHQTVIYLSGLSADAFPMALDC